MTGKVIAWTGIILFLFDLFKLTNPLERWFKLVLTNLYEALKDKKSILNITITTISVLLMIPLSLILPVFSLFILDLLFNHSKIFSLFFLITSDLISMQSFLKDVFTWHGIKYFCPSVFI